MSQKSYFLEMTRRGLLAGMATGAALAVSGDHRMIAGAHAAEPVHKRGGVLKLGIGGGSTTDTLDPRRLTDWVPVNQAYMLMNGLVEIDADNHAVPELLESWEAKPGAADWVFNMRQGVTFHNGKPLTVEDIIYSLNLHRGDTSSAARVVMAQIADIKKISATALRLTLKTGNADLPFALSDYHLLVVPDGFTDWLHPIGTGPFKFESFEPGVRSRFVRNENYWKPDCANVDAVEVIVINDIAARTNAVMSGQVHAINRIDFKTADLLRKNPRIQVVQSVGGQQFSFLMSCNQSPYGNNDVRLALKYAIDRDLLLKTVLRGYGQIGNDHPIPRTDPFFAAGLPQRPYDPDKSKFHLKKAGYDDLKVELSASDAAFAGAVDAAAIYRTTAAVAGIDLTIKRVPSDGYWDTVWMKAPFFMSYWGGRPTADQMLSIAYASSSSQNDTHWKNDQVDTLLAQARVLLDHEKRKQIYYTLQELISNEGGAIIPMFGDYLDAASVHVKGFTPHPMFNFMGARMAERVWLEA